MRNVLTFQQANDILTSYYEPIKVALADSFSDAIRAKNFLMESGLFMTMKPRTKGSLINDCLKSRLSEAFKDSAEVKVVEYGGVFGILIKEQVFIRFNKMTEGFNTSVIRTKKFQRYYNQSEEIDGLPERAMLVWGGYIPDRPWTEIKGYFLVCFAGGLKWYYDMGGNSVQQLSIDLTLKKSRRVTPKRKSNPGEQKTGTHD